MGIENVNYLRLKRYIHIMRTKQVHELLIQEDKIVNCIFCPKQIQDPGRPKRYFCCDSMRLIKDGYIVCKNCGQVHDEHFASEYIYFYESRHRIRKKSACSSEFPMNVCKILWRGGSLVMTSI